MYSRRILFRLNCWRISLNDDLQHEVPVRDFSNGMQTPIFILRLLWGVDRRWQLRRQLLELLSVPIALLAEISAVFLARVVVAVLAHLLTDELRSVLGLIFFERRRIRRLPMELLLEHLRKRLQRFLLVGSSVV